MIRCMVNAFHSSETSDDETERNGTEPPSSVRLLGKIINLGHGNTVGCLCYEECPSFRIPLIPI